MATGNIVERKRGNGQIKYEITVEGERDLLTGKRNRIFKTVDSKFPKRLKNSGIQCKPFSPITPFVSTHYNYRDHRKIMIIDGKTAFKGGINLADEYMNKISNKHIHCLYSLMNIGQK